MLGVTADDPAPEAPREPGVRLVLRPSLAKPDPGPSAARPARVAPTHAVVLAGGLGTRLRPYTLHSPKPLVTLDEYAILEVILRQLRAAGITRVSLAISYLGSMIEEAMGDGSRFGLTVDYYVDPQPLGTAGPLTLVPDWSEPVLVLNADILTLLDFGELYAAHLASGAVLTVAVHVTENPLGQGLVSIAEGRVVDLWEKPRLELDVCAGIYVVSAEARSMIPTGTRFDMTELVRRLVAEGLPVGAHRFRDEWYDIGTPTGLVRARRSFVERRSAYLRETPSPAPDPRRSEEVRHG